MARYLQEFELTPQAFASFVANPGDRGQANRAVVESVGGKLVEYYFGVGTNKIYLIAEYPNEVAFEALARSVLASGIITSAKTVAILTSAEAVEAMKMAGSAGYRPPAG
jgi:uncharacterized protein with GYD domain